MQEPFAEVLHAWHDFYLLAGTASATLLGLMFVAASIGASVFTEKHRAPMRAFLSPTSVHFSAVLLLCLLAAPPWPSAFSLAIALAVSGAAGTIYSARVAADIFIRGHFHIDIADRAFYGVIPLIGHLLVVAAAILLFTRHAAGLEVFAAALMALLAASIRNAWDMMVWIVIRVPVPAGEEPTRNPDG
jgi:hypothetical protein